MFSEIEFLKEVFTSLVTANLWVTPSDIAKKLEYSLAEVRVPIATLYTGGYIIRKEVGNSYLYRMNPNISKEQIEEIADAAITVEDFIALSPIPEWERQSFRYKRKAEVVFLMDAIDDAKKRSDIQLDNLEKLAMASVDALENYLQKLEAQDIKLRTLRNIVNVTDLSFWEYVKNLPGAEKYE